MSFFIPYYLHELGTVAHRKTKPPSAVHALSRAVRFYKGFPGVILLKSVVFRGFAVIDFFVEAMFFCTNYNIGSGVTDNIKCDNSHTGEIYVIGGESVYRMMLPYLDTIYVTKIDHAFQADTFFPNLDELEDWEMTEEGDEQTCFDLEFAFTRYERR